ncbi:type VII secretion protein EssC [Virgibacillus halodenitrificans]|uniref:type VII secretion protein EssC n=1 Tax=Virgibacillus halodenitrificans TaxID=1482 RepID=UPI000EF487D7|nr:type VII secretion protein EssC [Virgibacillus halodenitrificans]
MRELWVFYKDYYQRLGIDDLKEITIGNQLHHTLTIKAVEIPTPYRLELNEDRTVLYLDQEVIHDLKEGVPLPVFIDGQEVKFLITTSKYETKMFYTGNRTEISIPHAADLPAFRMLKQNKRWCVLPIDEAVYINGQQIRSRTVLNCGDIIYSAGSLVTLTDDDTLELSTHENIQMELEQIELPSSVLKQKYPKYRRTPRMIYEQPEDKIDFSFPSEESEDNQRGLWLIIMPPLMMLIVMGVVALVRPRGIFILISVAMFGTTLVTSTVQYFKEKKKQRHRKEKRKRLYTRYLENKREELQNLADKQRDVLYYHFPSFERMKYLTNEISNRIWERTLVSNDFLQFRVGRASVPASFKVSAQRTDMSNQEIDDLLEKSQELVSHYKTIKNSPLVINLSEGSMGMIGKDSIVKKEIQQIVGQLSFSQSYHDVRFVAIFDEQEYASWEWMKWLPHFQLPHAYAKGFIYNEQTRDQLLTSIYELLKERDLDEEKDKKIFSPHFVFLITNRQLISEHVILEYLEGEHADIGISTIFAADTKESLSENIHTLVRYIDETQGDILIQQQKAVHIPFYLDEHTKQDNETFARTLRSLDHQLGMSNSIPDKVSFLELFHTEDAAEIGIQEKWLENQSSKSLAVPVGLKGKDDYVYLNLHEKAHGPHGLLAGTTGSGKSEFLQSYILSLAVHYHPYEVAFLLIDYKGGGMAQPFKSMPHLLGTITNIEGSKNFSKRALASIKSELKRRQRLFDMYEVNHINDYTDLYKEGEAEEPLPHLFLISDEFAELKSEEPEFIRELVSAARIGRSLGVHLILATQKPGGIIDDQIWSNARFKVALKVQDESDSKEILKNGDAAKITVTGRGYLQVGNNEVYELFQSAWSGAPYTKEAFGAEDEIALVTDLGLIPLSDVATEESGKKDKRTEIDAVVEEIAVVQQRLNINKLPSPWLPPLPSRAFAPEQISNEVNHYAIAMVDEPEQQRQMPYTYKAMDDGNIGVFGSSGYGKSTTLQTLLLAFAEENSPEAFNCYIFDFGNGALLPLQQLPHTGDYFRSDDQRKIEKFLTFMAEEMERRKQLFRSKEVSNIKMYNLISEESLPLIYIAIDNYDLVKEEMIDLENRFTQIARDGQSLGVYTVLTATRSNAVKHALMSNLKTKIAHYLMDQAEKYAIIGKTQYDTEAMPGRVYIKNDDAFLAQIYLPVAGETDVEVLENIKEKVKQLKETYKHSEKPEGIAMLPQRLGFITFYQDYNVIPSKTKLAIGLDEDTVKPVYIDWQKNRHCLILGDAQKGKTNMLQLIIHRMQEQADAQIGVFDSVDRSLANYVDESGVTYMEVKEHVENWLNTAGSEFESREEKYREALRERTLANLQFTPYILLVDSMANFQQNLDAGLQTKIADFIKKYSHLGFSFIATGNANEFSKGFDPLTSEVKQIKQAILLMKKSDQSFITLPYTRNEPEIKAGFGYFVVNGQVKKIQVPHYDAERVTAT